MPKSYLYFPTVCDLAAFYQTTSTALLQRYKVLGIAIKYIPLFTQAMSLQLL